MTATTQRKRFDKFIAAISEGSDFNPESTANAEEREAILKAAAFEYRRGLADDIDEMISESGLLDSEADPWLRRQLADDIAAYFTGGRA